MAGIGTEDVKFDGLKELIKNLEQFERKVAFKILRRGIRFAAFVIRDEARRRAPHLEGALRKGIKVRSIKRSRVRVGLVVLTPTRAQLGIPVVKAGYYPATQEYGSNEINVPARFFMSGALESKRQVAIDHAALSIKNDIRKQRFKT